MKIIFIANAIKEWVSYPEIKPSMNGIVLNDVLCLANLLNKRKNLLTEDSEITTNGLFVSTYLQYLGWEVILVNNFYRDFPSAVKQIKRREKVIVIISSHYLAPNSERTMAKIIKEVKKKLPQSVFILGGKYVLSRYLDKWLLFREWLDFIGQLDIDYVIVSGDGTRELAILLERIDRKKIHFSKQKPILIKGKGDLFNFPEKFYPLTFENMPVGIKQTAVITAVGCPFSCKFCGYKYLSEKLQYFSLETVIKILKNITTSSLIRHIRFSDESFTVPPERFEEICKVILRYNCGYTWSSFARAGTITPRVARLMKQSGCNMVSLGIESGSDFMLRQMDKGINTKQVRKTVDILKNSGITVAASILVGFFGETEETIEETIRFLSSSGVDIFRANIWYPAPGSPMFQDKKLMAQFKRTNKGWQHNTMNYEEAKRQTYKIIFNTTRAIPGPLGTSIPWHWSVLSGEGYSPKEIIDLYRKHHQLTQGIKEKLLLSP